MGILAVQESLFVCENDEERGNVLEQNTIFAEKYLIGQLIGKGGMGSVYLAEDICNHMVYAIKEEIISPSNEQLLRQEASILLKLNHPLLPKAYQVLEQDGRFYIVMEYVRGETLESLLDRTGIIPEKTARKWFQQVCSVLVYLHGLDVPVVYRDLKPANIMVQPSGDIKIIDFGIAQEYRKDEKNGKKILALTRGYAAPEQYDNRYRDDVRTDIYALGVTMHYMLTGKNPNKPPYHFRPVRKLNSELSLAVEFIVGKCLQPNPDKRYSNALELFRELDDIQSLEKRLQSKRRKRFALMAIAGISILCVATLVFMGVKRHRGNTIDNYYQYMEKAHAYEAVNAFEDAMQMYEAAIEMQPDAWDAYLGKAKVFLSLGEYSDCQEWLKETAEKFPKIFENEEFIMILDMLYEKEQTDINTVYEEDTVK